jgi:hypothetical protein
LPLYWNERSGAVAFLPELIEAGPINQRQMSDANIAPAS